MFENAKIRNRINRYTKADLMNYAGDLQLKKYSRLNKEELVDAIVANLLDPDVMFYRMSIYDDKTIELFERGMGNPCEVTDDEFDTACIFNEIDYGTIGNGNLFIYEEVAKVWPKVRNESFEAYRKRASWVWKCLYWTEEMYGFTPIGKFLDVINVKKGFRMTDKELLEIFDHFPLDRLWTVRGEDIFVSAVFADNDKAVEYLLSRQAGKDYYLPSVSEVEELYDTGALLSDPAYQDMKMFMTDEMMLPDDEAEDILYELWDKIAIEDDFHDAMQWFWNQFEFQGEEQVQKIISLYMPLANGTRMRMNRGHKPDEILTDMKFGPGNMPTIVPGSTHAAKMLAEAEPQIRQMGFGLDLDSNASTIPVMQMPEGKNGPIKVAQKKIYPNDPCPCGSGLKYKKCCGRNR